MVAVDGGRSRCKRVTLMNADPDILAALRTIAAGADKPRLSQVRKQHSEATARRFETQMELLADEVEELVPRNHPLFESVVLLTVIRKMERVEPEFNSYLDDGFPEGF